MQLGFYINNYKHPGLINISFLTTIFIICLGFLMFTNDFFDKKGIVNYLIRLVQIVILKKD